MKIFLIILLIGYILCWLYLIIEWILTLIPSVKCRHLQNCKIDDCPIRKYCRRTSLSDTEKEALWELLDSIK